MNKIISLIIIFMLSVQTVSAGGIKQDLEKFWQNGLGQNGKVNKSWRSQAAGYRSLGSIKGTNRVSDRKLASVTPPHISAGCGGFKFMTGAFSYISKDEIVNALKDIGANSTGLLLMMAIEEISPKWGQSIQEFFNIAQTQGNMNINSCESSAQALGALLPRTERGSEKLCSAYLGNRKNIIDDYAQARQGCNEPKERVKHLEALEKQSDHDPRYKYDNINVSWEALKKGGVAGVNSKEGVYPLAEALMTIAGTIIIKRDKAGKVVTNRIDGKYKDKKLLDIILYGGEADFYSCDKDDNNLCLNPSLVKRKDIGGKTDSAYSIGEVALVNAVEKNIKSIIHKMKSDAKLTDEEEHFIRNKNIPILYILKSYARFDRDSVLLELPQYTDIIATTMLYQYLEDVINEVALLANNLDMANQDALDAYRRDVYSAQQYVLAKQRELDTKIVSLETLLRRTDILDKQMQQRDADRMIKSRSWTI